MTSRKHGIAGRIPPAIAPAPFLGEKLLHVDVARECFDARPIGELPDLLGARDLLVVNDAATIPASLPARVRGASTPHAIEVRLLAERGPSTWDAILFGEGDHRTPTERRALPPRLPIGARIDVGAMSAEIVAISSTSPRHVTLAFDREGAAFFAEIYRVGRLVQYAHLAERLPLWSMQSAFSSRPWAVEMPSAGRPLRWELLDRMLRRGVSLAVLTHAAGLSSTGDDAIDRALPLVERYEIPARTAALVASTRAAGGRIVAVGTSVVRALESSARSHHGRVVAESAETDLRVDGRTRLHVVDALLTGIHDDPTTSHHDLLAAFAPPALLARAHEFASRNGFVGHELGDSTFIARGRAA